MRVKLEDRYPEIVKLTREIDDTYVKLLFTVLDYAEKEKWSVYHAQASAVSLTMDIIKNIVRSLERFSDALSQAVKKLEGEHGDKGEVGSSSLRSEGKDSSLGYV